MKSCVQSWEEGSVDEALSVKIITTWAQMPRTYVKSQRQHGVSVILALGRQRPVDPWGLMASLFSQISGLQVPPSSVRDPGSKEWGGETIGENGGHLTSADDFHGHVCASSMTVHMLARKCVHTHTHTHLWNTKQNKKPLYLTRCPKGCCPRGISVEKEEQKKLLTWWSTPVWMSLTQRIHFVQTYSGAVSSNLCGFMYLS